MDSRDTKIIRAIIGRTCKLTPEEVKAEENAITSEDYDQWVLHALQARIRGDIQRDANGDNVEHPTTRVLRIGIESIKSGKPSSLFLELLELIANSANANDVLRFAFSDVFKPISTAQMKAADDYAWIADEYRNFIDKRSRVGQGDLDGMKEVFKKDMEIQGVSAKTVDRALEMAGLNWPAKRGAKIKPKNKKESW